MILEKLIRSAKIVTTNTGFYALPVVAGMWIAGSLVDGKIDKNDIPFLAGTGVLLAIAAVVTRKELYAYDRISDYCKQYGFDPWVLNHWNNPTDLRKAKLYATESGRMDQFEQAMREYRLKISSF